MKKYFDIIAALAVIFIVQVLGTVVFAGILDWNTLFTSIANFFGTVFALKWLGPKIGLVYKREQKRPL